MLVANARIVQSYSIYTFWGELIILISILSFYIVVVFESYVIFQGVPMFTDMYGVFQNMMGDSMFWINQLFCLLVLPAFDFMVGIVINAIKQRTGYINEQEQFSNLSEPFQTRQQYNKGSILK